MPRTTQSESRTSRPSAPQRSGFTFVELLVATLLMTGVGAVLVNSFRIQMRHRADAEVTAETYQGLVATLDSRPGSRSNPPLPAIRAAAQPVHGAGAGRIAS
jgi:type II secretory pathway pseudopilin PulG